MKAMDIGLRSGACVPFVEGSGSAERGYMSTMSTVKVWENELTAGMFNVFTDGNGRLKPVIQLAGYGFVGFVIRCCAIHFRHRQG